MKKRAEYALHDIPELECAGIYALTDETGKMYIGSAVNLKKRLNQHNSGMSVALSGRQDAFESQRLQEAVVAGRKFSVSILATFPCGLSVPLLRQIEREFIAEYLQKAPLYNTTIRGVKPYQLE